MTLLILSLSETIFLLQLKSVVKWSVLGIHTVKILNLASQVVISFSVPHNHAKQHGCIPEFLMKEKQKKDS